MGALSITEIFMRFVMSIPIFVILAGSALGQEDGSVLNLSELKIGQQGYFPKQSDAFYFKIQEVLGPDMIQVFTAGLRTDGVRTAEWTRKDASFVIRGVPTNGLGEDSRVVLWGRFEVKDTMKVAGKTVFVFESKPP